MPIKIIKNKRDKLKEDKTQQELQVAYVELSFRHKKFPGIYPEFDMPYKEFVKNYKKIWYEHYPVTEITRRELPESKPTARPGKPAKFKSDYTPDKIKILNLLKMEEEVLTIKGVEFSSIKCIALIFGLTMHQVKYRLSSTSKNFKDWKVSTKKIRR
jgi:hypothetical protein